MPYDPNWKTNPRIQAAKAFLEAGYAQLTLDGEYWYLTPAGLRSGIEGGEEATNDTQT